MMLRSNDSARLATVLLGGALAVTFVLVPRTADLVAAAVVRVEVRQAGPYVLDIVLDADPPHVERSLGITVRALPGTPPLDGVSLTVTGLPGDRTHAVPTRVRRLRPDPREPGDYAGEIAFAVAGAWVLEVRAAGPAGTGAVRLPLTVGAPPAIPVWVGWMIGLSPLIGVIWFGWWNLGYLRRLRQEFEMNG